MTDDRVPQSARFLDSASIPVSQFRQTFHLPLSLLDPDSAGGPEAQICRLFAGIMADERWQPVASDFTDATGPRSYEEAAYFHDFVRDFLYATDLDQEHRTFRRTDLIGTNLIFHLGAGNLVFAITTLELRSRLITSK